MSLSKELLSWYDLNRRELPWRGTRDPYRIWLSEIMLQQTRVETVERYYQRFLERYPTVQALARAPEDDVLKLWEGLGYYSRARNLHAAARRVAEELGGAFPDSAPGLRSLPGVGPYAANAIASIAYGEPVPALDGNQARVLSRILAHDAPLRSPFDLCAPAAEWIDRRRPGDYNQALMDLGSAICTPRKPGCDACPLSPLCRARAEGDPERYPLRPAPIAKRDENRTILLVQMGNRICIRRRDEKKLLGGLYEFPSTEGFLNQEDASRFLEEQGFGGLSGFESLPTAKHVFTHLIWHMQGWRVRAAQAPDGMICANAQELQSRAFPSALRKYFELALNTLEAEE